MMQFGNLALAQSLAQGQFSQDLEDEYISKMLLRIVGDSSSDGFTAAEAKAMWINARVIKGGKETILVDASLYDMLGITDFNGGYACAFASGATKMPVGNVVIPMGLDLRAEGGGGHLEFRFQIPATIANTKYSVYSLNDGSRPTTLRYRTLKTTGTAAYENLFKLFSRDETDTSSNIKIGTDKIKPIYHDMGRVALQEWASVEASSIFSQMVSQDAPGSVVVYPTAELTLLSVEAP